MVCSAVATFVDINSNAQYVHISDLYFFVALLKMPFIIFKLIFFVDSL